MKLLEGKKALIFGLANKNSIAWGISQVFHEHGAELGFSYAIPQLEKRVVPLAESVGSTFVEMCDVTKDKDIDQVFEKAADHFGTIDILVHSIAYAPNDELGGRFIDTSRSGFATALDISAYSLIALSREGAKLMPNGGSIITMTYYASQKVFPFYNVMGIAKAALEANVRYLAADLGPNGIRVNALSPGPVKTLAAAGVGHIRKMMKYVEGAAPLRRNIDQEEIGQTALWLCSDWASAVTGETIYIDSGYHILGMPEVPENWQ
jgi:enoyl-[acyl-carrier protein] reductase I